MNARSSLSSKPTGGAGVREYVKHAFRYHWNLLIFIGGAGLAAMSPWPDALLPIVGGLELAYLTGLVASQRFRAAIDAKIAKARRLKESEPAREPSAEQTLQRLIESLPAASLRRFIVLRQRCFEMRDIASGVRGHANAAADSSESIRTPALDRLLFLFLRLLVSQDGLERFL
ncbi:MAG: hypothetical protein ACREMQ_17565, partial [Longimicrobiales bacterium]